MRIYSFSAELFDGLALSSFLSISHTPSKICAAEIQCPCCFFLFFFFFSLESQLQSQLDFIMAYTLFHLLSVITVIVKLKAKSRIVAFLWLPLLYTLCWRAVVTAFLSLFLGFTPFAGEQAFSHCFPSVNTVTFSFLSGLCF